MKRKSKETITEEAIRITDEAMTAEIIRKATCDTIGQLIAEMIDNHYERLIATSLADERGVARIGTSILISFKGKVPSGEVRLGYGVKTKVKEEFCIPDPDQSNLNLGKE